MPFWREQRWHWNQDESTSHFKCNDETKKFDPEATLNPILVILLGLPC